MKKAYDCDHSEQRQSIIINEIARGSRSLLQYDPGLAAVNHRRDFVAAPIPKVTI
ncbi:unnamed protein product [Amoebophrya sp. A120]|nr:unnamed protein product [Amoebophrya sp. A120]|eukprot:GSA120T00017160001.1